MNPIEKALAQADKITAANAELEALSRPATPPTYAVTLHVRQVDAKGTVREGDGVIEVPTYQGAEAAGRRAKWSAVATGWGDVDEVTVTSSVLMP